jgi:hypothetical protein
MLLLLLWLSVLPLLVTTPGAVPAPLPGVVAGPVLLDDDSSVNIRPRASEQAFSFSEQRLGRRYRLPLLVLLVCDESKGCPGEGNLPNSWKIALCLLLLS